MIKKRSKVTLKAREFDRHKPQWNLSDSGEILFDEAALKSLRAKKYVKKIASKLEKKATTSLDKGDYVAIKGENRKGYIKSIVFGGDEGDDYYWVALVEDLDKEEPYYEDELRLIKKKVMSGVSEEEDYEELHDDSYLPIQVINDTLKQLYPESSDSMNLFGRAIIDALEDHGYEIVKKDNSSWYRK